MIHFIFYFLKTTLNYRVHLKNKMGRGYKSSRDLEFRLNKDDIIIYEAGDFKRTSKYT